MAAGDFIHGRLISLDNCVSPASPTPGIAGSRAVAAGAGVLMSCHIEPDINYLLSIIYISYNLYHVISISYNLINSGGFFIAKTSASPALNFEDVSGC